MGIVRTVLAGFLLTLIFVSFPGFLSRTSAQQISLKVLTYNIRYANPGDAPNSWPQRRDKVCSLIKEVEPDVFGMQEALKDQVADIEAAFPAFERVGVGRDDGKEAGEYSPIFFSTDKYTLMKSGVFWLSQTPALAGSRGWDAACNRVVSWIQLKEKIFGTGFWVFCTHFDHMGEIARRNSAKLLLQAVDSLAGTQAAIVLGDFNSVPGSEPYGIITSKSDPLRLTDAVTLCSEASGPEYTYTGFKVGGLPGERIDYIFLKGKFQVISYTVNPANDGQYYPSDHLPVSAALRIF